MATTKSDPSEPLLTVTAKANRFSGLYVDLDGDQIFKGSLIPGYKITASQANPGTVVLTITQD
jgi:hypothetical protein